MQLAACPRSSIGRLLHSSQCLNQRAVICSSGCILILQQYVPLHFHFSQETNFFDILICMPGMYCSLRHQTELPHDYCWWRTAAFQYSIVFHYHTRGKTADSSPWYDTHSSSSGSSCGSRANYLLRRQRAETGDLRVEQLAPRMIKKLIFSDYLCFAFRRDQLSFSSP